MRKFSRPGSLLAAALAVLALAWWPTIYNGFPLLFSDSAQYACFALRGCRETHIGYPIYYSGFIAPLLYVRGFLAIAIVQGLLASTVLYAFHRNVAGSTPTRALATTAAVLSLTQLPWLNSWIMADVFTGLGFLALMTLVFPRKPMSPLVVATLLLLVLACCLVATGSLLVLATVSASIIVARRMLGSPLSIRTYRNSVVFGLTVVVLAAAPNAYLYGKVTLNAGGAAMSFAKLVDDGVAQDYLQSQCASRGYRVCAHLDELAKLKGQSQGFLWGEARLAEKTLAWRDPDGELGRLNRAILSARAPSILRSAARSAGKLLLATALGTDTADDNWQRYAPDHPMMTYLANEMPNARVAFDNSRQQRGRLARSNLNTLYSVSIYASYGVVLALLIAAVHQRALLVVAVLGILVYFLITNAVIHGGLVGPFVRYAARVTWVVWPVVFAGIELLRMPHDHSAHGSAPAFT